MSDLPARLRLLGLAESVPVVIHANRRVLVSLTTTGALRVHGGYAEAPDEVVAAIAAWARPRTRRAERLVAQRILTAFPVHLHSPSPCAAERAGEAPHSGDGRLLERLRALHAELNVRHFRGELGPVTLRVSHRMRRRLGECRPPGAPGEPAEIALGRRHIQRDGWARAADTLLHEMVHQWQAETGRPLGHGPDFRRKCREIGIEGRAIARFGTDFRSYLLRRV